MPPPDAHTPTRLPALRGKRVLALAAGEYHAVASVAGAPLLTWGAGSGAPGGAVVPVSGLPKHVGEDVVALAAGYQHTLASIDGACTVAVAAKEL